MANRRMISSSTWKDEFVGDLDFFQRCLWIGLFSSCADDQGRLLDNPILIRAELFPYDDIQIDKIETGLSIFESSGKIMRYSINNKKYIQLLRWWENQNPRWASRSKYPPPENWTDKVRTRENGKYIVENWDETGGMSDDSDCSYESLDKHSYEDTVLNPQYPVPVPDPIPVPVPDVNQQEPCQNFYSEFSQTLQIPLMGGKDLEYLQDLQRQHDDAKLLKIATWLKERDPTINSMWKALRAIDTAAENWTDTPPKNKKGNPSAYQTLKALVEQEATK